MKYNEFFGSKLNTVLLLVLIVLMVFAIRIMLRNEDVYLHPFTSQVSTKQTNPKIDIKVFPPPDSNLPPCCKEGNLWGNKEDLISFSGEINSNKFTFFGSVKNSYFFEGNILVNVSSEDGKMVKNSHGSALGNWMTSGPVLFTGSVDLTGLPKGYNIIEIKNDNPSGLSKNDKSIFIKFLR